MDRELHDLRWRNEQLAGDIDLLQTLEDVIEERHRAKIEEVIGKATPLRGILMWRHPSSGLGPRMMTRAQAILTVSLMVMVRHSAVARSFVVAYP